MVFGYRSSLAIVEVTDEDQQRQLSRYLARRAFALDRDSSIVCALE
jgi:hypothetical protein